MDICFIGSRENIDRELERTKTELENLLRGFEAESVADIQPVDMDEDEILPDATVYDTIRFIVKELEFDKKIHCNCESGDYDLRFVKGGIEIFCKECGASYVFNTEAAAAAEEYLNLDSLNLK